MKKITNTTEEKPLLKPFPFNEDKEYLLQLANGTYVVASWWRGGFTSTYGDIEVDGEIKRFVALKELGL